MTGIERFVAGLDELGLAYERRGGTVVLWLDLSPEGLAGPHEVGVDPPSDFPSVPPHWFHMRSKLVLAEGGGQASELGGEWQKWSRPHPKWCGGPQAVREWIAHAHSLILTARAR